MRSSTSPADERKDTYKDEENSAAIEPRRHTSPDHRLPTLLTSPGIFTQHQLDSVLYGHGSHDSTLSSPSRLSYGKSQFYYYRFS